MRICPHCRAETEAALCPDDGYRTVVVRDVVPEADPMVGRVFEGRYQVLSLLGRGGFGAVYRATQLGIGRDVALKVLHAADDDRALPEIARFQQEARALAALKHPNIVDIYDFGQADDGSLYLVMEHLRGRPLDAYLDERKRLDPREIVEIALQVCDALADAHAAGIVHRDLKPHNLFLAEGTRGRVVLKVLDFGIARMTGDHAAVAITRTGAFLGSPPYMSPEQSAGKPVTAQSDLYSLGCVLYQLLLGRYLFAHTSATAWAVAHVLEDVDLPAIDGEPVRGPLADLVMALLRKEPDARPQGMDEVCRRLEAMRATPLDAPSMALVLSERGRPEGVTAATPMLALARTLRRPDPLQTGRAATHLRPTRKRPSILPAVAAAFVVVAVVVGSIIALSSKPAVLGQHLGPSRTVVTAAPNDAPATPEVVSAAPAPTPTVAPAPTVTAAPTPTVTPAPAPELHDVKLVATPPAEVWRDGALLGTTPLTITWSALPPTLELKAPRHRPLQIALTIDDAAAGTREVALERIRPKPGAGTPDKAPVVGPSW